jgi:hypothetical protein
MTTESNLQNASKWEVGCNTESLPTKQGNRSNGKVQSILTLAQKLWQNAIAAPASEPELKIWQKQDRCGRIHWHIDDPSTGKSVSFASELEMMRWLENLTSRSHW